MNKKAYVSPRIITVALASEQGVMTGSEQLQIKNGADYDYTKLDDDVKDNRDADGTLWID